MQITIKALAQSNACEQGQKRFLRMFPDGVCELTYDNILDYIRNDASPMPFKLHRVCEEYRVTSGVNHVFWMMPMLGLSDAQMTKLAGTLRRWEAEYVFTEDEDKDLDKYCELAAREFAHIIDMLEK